MNFGMMKKRSLKIQQQSEPGCIGQWMVFVSKRVDITEVNAEEFVPDAGSESHKLPVAIVGIFVVVAASDRKKIIIPVFQARGNHQLLKTIEFNRFAGTYIALKAAPGCKQGFNGTVAAPRHNFGKIVGQGKAVDPFSIKVGG